MSQQLKGVFDNSNFNPKGWELVELKELISDVRGGAPLEPDDFFEEGFPVLHKGAIKPAGQIEIDPNKKTFTHDNFVRKHSRSIVDREYVAVTLRDLIPTGPTIGMMAYLKNGPFSEYILAQGAYAFLVNQDRVYPEYLVWLSNTYPYRKFIRSLAVGSTQIHVRTPIFTSISIPLPPLTEQKRIAAILAKADRLRRLRRYARELSDGYLQSVFLEMFGDPVSNPRGWKIRPLSDSIAGFEGGVNFPPVSNGELASSWRVLKISAITWGDFDPSESKPIRPDVKFDNSLVVRKGDLLISRANTTELVGAVCMVRNPPPKVLLPDKLWRVCFSKNSKLLPDYTLYALRQHGLRKIIGDLATGSSGSMKNISREKAATLPIPLAPLPLQQKFAQIVQKHERLRAQQREAERQAEHLFQSLLHRAFRGEV